MRARRTRARTKRSIRASSREASSDGEARWPLSRSGTPRTYFELIVFKDEKWEPSQLNFDADVALTDRTATGLNAVDADLTRFFARGGKLLIYHGWSDPGIPPQNAVNYYQSVLRLDARQEGGSRLGPRVHGARDGALRGR